MKSIGGKDIAEAVGIMAIVASLIFVGLQLKQSQEIAIAAQYHNRAALAVEWMGDMMSTQSTMENSGIGVDVLRDVMPESATNATISIAFFSLNGYHTIADNHLYQYQAGFLDEESWQARRANLKSALRDEGSQIICLRGEFRASYQQLCRDLIAEID